MSIGNENGYVYFAMNNRLNIVKIGCSADPLRRVESLERECSDRLVLLGTIQGGFPVENRLHKRFTDLRLFGEWFAFHEEVGMLAEGGSSVEHQENEEQAIRIIDEPYPIYSPETIDRHSFLSRSYVSSLYIANRIARGESVSRRPCSTDGMVLRDWKRGIGMLISANVVRPSHDDGRGYKIIRPIHDALIELNERRKRDILMINAGVFPTYCEKMN